MLSLRRSMQELAENEAAHRAAAKAFAETAETAAKHVVEVDPEEAGRFRTQVLSLAERLGEQPGAEELLLARTSFQNELKDYASKASADVKRLKQELGAAAKAMQSFAQGVSNSGSEHEVVLKREFQRLTQAADTPDVRTLRAAVHETVAAVTASYQELKQAHSLVIAQLRDEIRVLQQDVQRERQAQPASGLLDKRELDRRIEECLRRHRPFVLLLAGLPGTAGRRLPQAVEQKALADFLQHLRSLLPAGTDGLGEFSPQLYGVLLPPSAAPDPAACQQQWTACHVFQEGGIPRTFKAEPRVAVVQYAAGESPTLFFGRLSAATESFWVNH